MFDGLKDKLSSFKKDVKEEAEAEVEEAEEAEAKQTEADADDEAKKAEAEAETEKAGSESKAKAAEGAHAEEAGDVQAEASGDVQAEAAEDVRAEEAGDIQEETESAEAKATGKTETESPEQAGDVDDAGESSAPDVGAVEADTDTDTGTGTGTDTDIETDADSESPDVAASADTETADTDETAETDESDSSSGSDIGTITDVSSPSSDDEAEEVDGSAETDPGLLGRAKLAATGKTVIEEEDLEKPLEELELALLSSDVEMSVTQEILRGVRENMIGETRAQVKSTGHVVEDALREALIDVISIGQFDFDERIAEADKPITIIFTGVNGVGKTTTIAKLSRYLEQRGFSSVLANGDTYRAGANEQLQEHAENLDRKVISHEQGSDPAAVIYDAVEYAEANDVDVVLGDTAGRLHTSNDLMDQLAKIDRVIEPDMTLFVDEAVAGQDAVQRASEFDDAAEIDGAVLTKADADPQGGAAISIAHVTGKPILFLGTGQEYNDIEQFDPGLIVDRLLGLADEE